MKGFFPLDSGTEGLDILGINVHLIDGHKSCCASQRKEQFFIFYLFYDVDDILTISECGEHEVGVLDPCFFFPFQSCLLRALNSDKPT